MEQEGDGMKETIIHYLQIGSVWMFVCIVYFFVTMIIAAMFDDHLDDSAGVAHAIGCLLFGVMFCLWLYGG